MNPKCLVIRRLTVSKLSASLTAFSLALLPARLPGTALSSSSSLDIVDRTGQPLRQFVASAAQRSHPMSLDDIAPTVILATLAAEDKRFFQHRGVDLTAAARAFWQNSRQGRIVSGGSTLTQQLVRMLDPRPKTWRGKVTEVVRAFRLEGKISKREILESYLNHVNYGNGCQGIEAAAQMYLGVPSQTLSLAQAALLAGIPKSPAYGEPLRHWERAARNQKTVLQRLRHWGWIDQESYDSALAERIQVMKSNRPWLAPHFTDLVRQHLVENPQKFQYPVTTTLDAGLQEFLEKLVEQHLQKLAAYHVTNAALVVIDNPTGNVLAWIGSANFFDEKRQGQVDGVTALRQPGSALKPFVYGLAFSKGMTPADILSDEPLFNKGYMPRNYDETYHGDVRMREALACSYNIPAVVLGERLGIDAILQTFHQFGLQSLNRPANHYGLGLVLGNGEVSLLELTNAYAALARNGIWRPVRMLTADPQHGARRVMDRESAYLVTDVLSDNTARTPAFGFNSAFHMPFPFAAKTGTTKDYRDNWAIGYSPLWTIGVWVGNFDGESMRRISGITGAAPLLRDAAFEVEKRYGTRPFSMPVGIREHDVCPDSGQLAGLYCAGILRERFRLGALPTQTCTKHQAPHQPPVRSDPTFEIKFPADGDVFKIDPRMAREAQQIRLEANVKDAHARITWWVNSQKLSSKNAMPWWMLRPGVHTLRATLDRPGQPKRTSSIRIRVIP